MEITEAILKLTALGMLAALSEQLTGESRLREGVRLIRGILTADLTLAAIFALTGALTP